MTVQGIEWVWWGVWKRRYTERKMKLEGDLWEEPALWSLSPIILCDQSTFIGATNRHKPLLANTHNIKLSEPTQSFCLHLGNLGILAGFARGKKNVLHFVWFTAASVFVYNILPDIWRQGASAVQLFHKCPLLTLIPSGLFLQFLKSQSLHGMVQL